VSPKSVAEKLLIKPDTSVWLSDSSHRGLIEPLPAGVRLVDTPDEASTALVFAADERTLREILSASGDQLTRPDLLWVAYPKANRADINRDTVWPILAERGLRPIGQVAVDDVWSALRFRLLRDGEAPFAGGR
jgi:hypothetical protein